jgi:hypothetical protein
MIKYLERQDILSDEIMFSLWYAEAILLLGLVWCYSVFRLFLFMWLTSYVVPRCHFAHTTWFQYWCSRLWTFCIAPDTDIWMCLTLHTCEKHVQGQSLKYIHNISSMYAVCLQNCARRVAEILFAFLEYLWPLNLNSICVCKYSCNTPLVS